MDKDLKKALTDRIYDKRKIAALELEQLIRTLIAEDQRNQVQEIIDELSQEFAYAVRHPNYRNGGLIGLAGVAIALGQTELANFLDAIVQPILACFGDADARVRYYACESLYNVAKVAKGEILQYFNEIFDVLCKLVADPEDSVRNGAELVDHLIKDIVAEKAATYTYLVTRDMPEPPPAIEQSPDGNQPAMQIAPPQQPGSFSLRNFIPLLVERIYVINPSTRMFLVQWIMLLDSIPDLQLVAYLPEFLNGLLLFLTDSHKEVRSFAKTALNGFQREIQKITEVQKKISCEKAQSPETGISGTMRKLNIDMVDAPKSAVESTAEALDDSNSNPPLLEQSSVADDSYIIGQDTIIDHARILNILLDKMDPSHGEMRLVVLEWFETLLEVSPGDVVAKLAPLLQALLPALSDEVPEIRAAGQHLSNKLLEYLSEHNKDISIDGAAAIAALDAELDNEEKITRMAALQWLSTLHRSNLVPTLGTTPDTVGVILRPLSDHSDEVVSQDLALIAQIFRDSSDAQFGEFVQQLLAALRNDSTLLASRGRTIFSQLCQKLNPEKIFRTVAGKLWTNRDNSPAADREFAELMVQNLTTILITSSELHIMRSQLRQLNTPHGAALFTVLFRSWSVSSISALALCLLAEAYEHAFAVLTITASLDVTVSTLVQIDRLVQLIEGPSFASMRLHLLEPHSFPFLYRTLYGLLMVLPQTGAFKTLSARLSSVTPIGNLPPPHGNSHRRSVQSSESGIEIKLQSINWDDLLDSFKRMHK